MPLQKLWPWLLVALLVAVGVGIYVPISSTGNEQGGAASRVASSAVRSAEVSIGALGRIEPRDGVVRLGARSLSGQPSIVGKVLVREGDAVYVGQVLAELDAAAQLQAM